MKNAKVPAVGNNNVLQLIVLASLLVFFSGCYVVPIWDIDFWWHIASGRWIVSEGVLPYQDPFSIFSVSDRIRNDTVLLGQWLGQVVLYEVFALFGHNGIICLRAFILCASLAILYARSRILGVSPAIATVILILAGIILEASTGDRPQLFSFILGSLLFLLIDLYEKRGHRTLLFCCTPIIALIWANMHGSYVLAVVLLVIYAASSLILSRRRNPEAGNPKTLFLLAALFFFFTLLTPNQFTTYQYIFDHENSIVGKLSSEYISPFRLYQLGQLPLQIYFMVYFLFSIISLYGLFICNKKKSAILFFLVAISASSMRYGAFMVLLGGPYAGKGLSFLAARHSFFGDISEEFRRTAFLLVPIVALFYLLRGLEDGSYFRTGISETKFPVGAVKFLEETRVKGKVFNLFEWGGYLIWTRYPEIKPYIDGRMLDRKRLEPYTHILWATPYGKKVFQEEAFNIVIIPEKTRYSGETYALFTALKGDNHWKWAYASDNAHVFIDEKTWKTFTP